MTGTCPFKYALGIPGTGFHAARIGPFAAYDTLGTIGLALLTWLLVRSIPFWKHLVAWFLLGEVLHFAFGTDTAFLRLAGLERGCPIN
jgi:hypothetical protein